MAWEVTSEAGENIPSTLNNDGGEIIFPSAGNYTVTASVTDHLGRTFTANAAISVWDTMGLSFKLPEFAHLDETVKVKMTSENVGDSKIAWSLTVDGQPVSLSAGISGTLDNAGGSVRFLQTGTNVLTASVTDGLGRAFTYEQTIEVYPVLSLTLTADAATHTDEQIRVNLSKDTDLPVTWKITPSNAPSAAVEYTGNLMDNGGTIQITGAGAYDISASVTDPTGRVFAAPAVSVMVYPVAGLDFTLPAAAWTDSSTPVDLLTSDLQGQDVTWTLTKDGAAVSLTGSMLGDLGNLGGKVRFPEVGTYTLTATAMDALGREYSCLQTIRIYPVVGLSLSAGDMSHTDTAEDVKLTCENLGNNEVVWTVLRDGNTVYSLAWIFPATNRIYVGDTVQAVRLTTGSSLYPSPYTWTIDPSYAGFNSSKPGTTEVQAVITKGGASFGRVTIPVTVVPRPILSVEEVVRTAPMGTAFNKLGLPSTVSVVAEGGTGNAQTVTGVPVTWSSTGYDPYALTQTVRGTLNLSRFPQLSGDNIPAVTATINLTYGTVEAPTVSDYAKTYDC